MSDRSVAEYFNNGEPKGLFCDSLIGRVRDVSVNDVTNRVFFVNDLYSLIYVCDTIQQQLLFTITKHVYYPICIHAKGAVVTVFNYILMWLTFYSLEGDFISAYKMSDYIFGLTMDYKGGLNLCSWNPDCIIEMHDSEIHQFGHDWLHHPTYIVSSGECLYVLDSSRLCCHVLRDKVRLRNVIASSPLVSRRVTLPCGLSVDRNGNIIISDTGDGSIVVFDPAGTLLCKVNSIGSSGRGVLRSVAGIDLSSKGDLYVACPVDGYLAFVL